MEISKISGDNDERERPHASLVSMLSGWSRERCRRCRGTHCAGGEPRRRQTCVLQRLTPRAPICEGASKLPCMRHAMASSILPTRAVDAGQDLGDVPTNSGTGSTRCNRPTVYPTHAMTLREIDDCATSEYSPHALSERSRNRTLCV